MDRLSGSSWSSSEMRRKQRVTKVAGANQPISAEGKVAMSRLFDDLCLEGTHPLQPREAGQSSGKDCRGSRCPSHRTHEIVSTRLLLHSGKETRFAYASTS